MIATALRSVRVFEHGCSSLHSFAVAAQTLAESVFPLSSFLSGFSCGTIESDSRLVRKVKFFATEDSFPPLFFFFYKMRHLAAYLLLRLGGNDAPDAEAVTAVLTAVGVEADADAVAKVVADLEGKVS